MLRVYRWSCSSGRSHQTNRIWSLNDTVAPDKGDETAALGGGVGGGV